MNKELTLVLFGCSHIYDIDDLLEGYKGDILIGTGDYESLRPWDVQGRYNHHLRMLSHLKNISSNFDRMILTNGNHTTHLDDRHPINQAKIGNAYTNDDSRRPLVEWCEIAKVDSHISNLYWSNDRVRVYEFDGLKILVTPLTPKIEDRGGGWQDPWAFHIDDEDKRKIEYFLNFHEGVDIIVSHGPPKGYGDRIWPKDELRGGHGQHVGEEFFNEIIDKWKPKYFINSHIHEDTNDGEYRLHSNGVTKVYNVSVTNDDNWLVHKPRVIKIEVPNK